MDFDISAIQKAYDSLPDAKPKKFVMFVSPYIYNMAKQAVKQNRPCFSKRNGKIYFSGIKMVVATFPKLK